MTVVVGLDVGGTKILALALDVETGRILSSIQVATPQEPSSLQAALADSTETVLGRVGAGGPAAIGVGIPGFLGLDGVARQAPNLPAAVGVDLGGELARRFGCAVVADNDANCAAWAARMIDAPDATSLVAVTLGTGIGAGLVVDGRLLRGANGFAGEPGHMIVDAGGWTCACGQQGCWEMYASGNGLGRLASRAVLDGHGSALEAAAAGGEVDGVLVGRLAAAGDPEALAVLESYSGWIAVGLATLVNLLDPEVLFLGGGVASMGDLLLSRVRRALDGYPTVRTGRQPVVRISSVGPQAGAIGAAWLAAGTLSGDRPAPR